MSENDIKKLPGIKEDELSRLGSCSVCGNKMLAASHGREAVDLTFYKITIERAAWDMNAVRQRIGLQMLMGGHTKIARTMAPNADLAKVWAGPITVFVHESCADKIAHLSALIPERKETEPAPKEDDQTPEEAALQEEAKRELRW